MAQWVSKGGKWVPAKEYAVLPHLAGTGKEIYTGPDRAALYHLYEIDKSGAVTNIGEDFKKSPEFLQMVRNLGFNKVEDYLASIGYDEEEAMKEWEKNSSEIKKHDLPKRIKAIEPEGGGTDFSGNNKSYKGGYGDHALVEK